jgi:hypothetical protein
VASRDNLPLRRDAAFAHRLTWAVAALLTVASASGLLFGAAVLYDTDPMLPVLLAQDAVGLFVGVPLLLGSAWLARRGSTRGLLVWMGALFYVAYFWYFYVIGVRVTVLFPVYIAIVSMSLFGVLYLFFALDAEEVKHRVTPRMPVRLTAGFLIGTAVFFALLWLGLVASHLAAGTELDAVSQYVIAIDGVVLLPLAFFGGVWLWQRRALGFALAGILLVKVAATFLTLIATTLMSLATVPPDPVQTSAYGVGLIVASALLVFCLRAVGPPEGRPTRRRRWSSSRRPGSVRTSRAPRSRCAARDDPGR